MVFSEEVKMMSSKYDIIKKPFYNYMVNYESVSFKPEKILEIYKSLDGLLEFININKINIEKKYISNLIYVHGAKQVLGNLFKYDNFFSYLKIIVKYMKNSKKKLTIKDKIKFYLLLLKYSSKKIIIKLIYKTGIDIKKIRKVINV